MTSRIDRWRVYWHKLCQECPKSYLEYLNFDITDEELDEAFVDKNIAWLNKMGYFHFENLWSHQLILHSLLKTPYKPNLVQIEILLKYAETVKSVLPSLEDYKEHMEKDKEIRKQDKELEKQINMEIEFGDPKSVKKEEIERTSQIYETQNAIRKRKYIEEEEEEIDTRKIWSREELIQEIAKSTVGEENPEELQLVIEHQLDILDEVIEKLGNKELLDLKGLIHEQEKTYDLITTKLTQNWKEILSKIRDAQLNSTIPSELISMDTYFMPKTEKGKYIQKEFEMVKIEKEIEPKRRNSMDAKEDLIEIQTTHPQLVENFKKEEKEFMKKKRILDFKQIDEEELNVNEIELKNWIKNMNYKKIQLNIQNGRIRKWNYSQSVREDLEFLEYKGWIKWNQK